MRASILAFFCGILLLQQCAAVPPRAWLGAVLIPALVALGAGAGGRMLGWFAIGFLWAAFRADLSLATVLSPRLEGEALVASGSIEGLQQTTSFGLKFQFRVDALYRDGAAVSHPKRIRLTWYGLFEPRPGGARCRLIVRLQRPHGRRNPGGGDRERWMFSEGIGATGYVIGHPANACRPSALEGAVDRFRGRIAERIREAVPDPGRHGPLAALAVADRGAVDKHQWSVLRDTGTAHLLAISGLHIALIGGFAYAGARWTWSVLVPLAQRWPAQQAAAVAAMAAALGYAALAGFSLPTQRAAIMVTVAMSYQAMGYRALSADSYFTALAAILVYDPHAVLSTGFWLSFGAAGILVFSAGGQAVHGRSWWSRLLGVHLLLGFGLSPLLGAFFQAVPLASPLANMLAVPWVGFVVVPLVLAGIALSALGVTGDEQIWLAAGHAWDMLWRYLTWLEAYARVIVLPAPPGIAATALAACGVAMLLLPRGVPGRWLAPLLVLLPLVPGPAELRHGDYRFTLLDVGQGLAAVIQTAGHALVYDTGPSHGGGSNAGESVVLPFLRARGIDAIDLLVLSHGDSDHTGGAAAIIDALRVRSIMTNPDHPHPGATRRCQRGLAWQWDGVVFEVLHPAATSRGSRNELSCVIKATGIGGSVLLPGDIERTAEHGLVAAWGRRLHADVVVAPHHGSDTSSISEFIHAVGPGLALFSVGHRNRFGFPADAVTRRYREHGTRLLRTDTSGAIDIVFRDEPGRPRRFRADHRRYWHSVQPEPGD